MSGNKHQYNIAAIRNLLTTAFTPEELRRFCQDRPLFRPIIDLFGPKQGLADMVDETITYCEKRSLFDQLLDQIRLQNPVQYGRCGPYRHSAAKRANPPSTPIQVSTAVGLIALLAIAAFILWKQPFKPQPTPTQTPTSSPIAFCVEYKQPVPTPGPLDFEMEMTTQSPEIMVHNDLLVPVTVRVGDASYEIESRYGDHFIPSNYPADVQWQAGRQTNSQGVLIGEEMRGSANNLIQGYDLYIQVAIDNQPYFYPIVTNNRSQDCAVTVNEGLPNEMHPCSIKAGAKSIGLGYYRWFVGSTIVFQCGDATIRHSLLSAGSQWSPAYTNPTMGDGVIEITVSP